MTWNLQELPLHRVLAVVTCVMERYRRPVKREPAFALKKVE